MRSPWWQRTRLITTVLINLGNIMERADEQILPAGEVRDAQSNMGLSELLEQCSLETQQGGLQGLGPLSATPSCRHTGCRADSSKATTCSMALRTVHLGGLLNQEAEGLRHAMHMVLRTMQSSVVVSAVGILVLLL